MEAEPFKVHLYIIDTCWPFHVGDGRDLVGAGLDATSADDVA